MLKHEARHKTTILEAMTLDGGKTWGIDETRGVCQIIAAVMM